DLPARVRRALGGQRRDGGERGACNDPHPGRAYAHRMSERAEALKQYQSSAPFKVRRDTHRLYSEREVDLDAESARALGVTGVESLLDVGCGPGGFLRYLRGRDHQGRLVAFDQSDAMLAEALAHAAGVQGNAEHLPFRDATFDAVSARHMLYHVPDIPAAVRELGR